MNIIAILIFFWLVLSSQLSYFFISFAFASILLVYLLDRKLFNTTYLNINKESFIVVIKLVKEIVSSTLIVARIIWLDRKVIGRTKNLALDSDNFLDQVMQANRITLTPGTMSLKINKKKVLVHYLEEIQ